MATTPFGVKRFRIVFGACWLLWMVLQALILQWYQFSLSAAIADSVISNLLLIGACMLISNILNYYLPSKQRYGFLLALVAVLSLAWLFISRSILMLVTTEANDYKYFFTLSVPIRLAIAFLVLGAMTLLCALWYTLQDQQENEKRRNEAERLAKEAELFNLRQQLQPHFLFNSLNSINALIGLRPQQARTMIQQLSDFLRGTLKKDDTSWISFEEELQHLQLYLEIEKVRFGHRLSTLVEGEVEGSPKLPALLLQPIVENAIKFGLYDTTEPITIRIHARTEGDLLVIQVENPYDPATASPKKGTGFGLNSVQRRLFLLFARNDLLLTKATAHQFITTVKIPQTHDQMYIDRR